MALEESRGWTMRLQDFSACVHRGVSRYFSWHGAFVSRWPCMIIIACLLMSVTLMTMYYTIMEKESDSKKLFTPKNARSFEDRDVYEELYGIPPSQTRILVTKNVDLTEKSDCFRRGLLVEKESARQYLLEMFSLLRLVQSIKIEHKGLSYGMEDLCERTHQDGPCELMSVLSMWDYSETKLKADPNPVQTLTGNSTAVERRSGGTTYLLGSRDDTQICPGNIEAIQSWIILKYQPEHIDGARYDPKNREWNRELVKTLSNEWKSDNLKVYVSNLDAVDMESERTLEKDQRLLWLSYAMVLIYCHLALFKNSRARSKAHLAVISCLSVVMAIYSAYGLCQVFGVKFNPVHRVLPFLLMGLGVDDTFVIMNAYSDTDISASVTERMRQTSIRAGSSILVTSVTDFAAFMSGTFTTLGGLRDFSIYAAVGILFDFLYQITFFLAFLALDARRERRHYDKWTNNEANVRNGSSHLNGSTRCDSQHHLGEYLFNGGRRNIEPFDIDEEEETPALSSTSRTVHFLDRKFFGSGPYIPRPSFASILVGKWMPQLTLDPYGKAAVLLMEMVLLGLSIYGCTQVKMDFRYEEWFIPKSSYLHQAFAIEQDYFVGNQVPFHAITREIHPNAHFDAQRELGQFANALRNDPHVASTPPIHCWFEDFMRFAAEIEPPSRFQNSTYLDPKDFLSGLHQFVEGPGSVYHKDVIFDASGTELQAARVSAFTTGIGSGWSAVHTVDSIRNTVEAAAPCLQPVAYSYTFLYYDGYRVIAWETMRNVMIAAFAVFLVTLIILANFSACVAVLLMVMLTDIMLFGLMWYLNLTFNSVTCICMVLAVGVAVDYSVHIAHYFLASSGTPTERAKHALHHIGGAVLNGAFTTGLAIAVLGFANHYILQTFFKMFFSIVFCGLWHGLVILPVVLSIFGPAPYITHDPGYEP